jgi:F-type H+-transporting ATPase subunit b
MTLSYLASSEPNPLGFNGPELVLVLIVFLALLYLVAKFVVPSFEKSFELRRDAIEGGIARAEEAQAEAARLLEQYNAQLAQARTEAAQIREGARAEAQRIVEEMRGQAQAEAARIVARGEEQLAAQRSQVVRELRSEIGALAVELSEKIVDQQLSDDANVRSTVDAFLADIERQEAASGGAGSSA